MEKYMGFLNGVFTVCDTKEDFFKKIEKLEPFQLNSNENPLVDAFLSTLKSGGMSMKNCGSFALPVS